jgi:hypothetical protein
MSNFWAKIISCPGIWIFGCFLISHETLISIGCYLPGITSGLSYLTEAVLPIYVLHQPILLVAAFLHLPIALPLGIEVALLILVTGLGSFLIYELAIRHTRITRFLFGLTTSDQSR